jgi:oligogalacturonide lyase
MAKGSVFQFKFFEYRDSSTGIRVTRLSPPDVACMRNYFYQKCFSRDGGRLIFGSELDGEINIWQLDLGTGAAHQLSEGKGNNYHGAYVSSDDKYLFYTQGGRRYIRVDLESLEEEVVYNAPDGWVMAGTWVPNSAGTHIAGMEMRASDRVTGFQGWERFRKQFEAKPRQRLIDVDIESGTARVVLDQRRHMGHPMFRPFDDNLMGFCHEGPHDLIDARIWFIDRDGSNLRKVKEQAEGEACMHEFWIPDGSRLIYVSYIKGRRERSIWAVDPETLENENLMAIPPCEHLMSDFHGDFLVGDGAGHLEDVDDKEGYAFPPDPHIYLFDMKNRSHLRVCRHDTSWAVYKGDSQASHPHPSFTPDGKKVLFSSDFSGKPALYLADLPIL